MKNLVSASKQQYVVNDIMINHISEYILENNKNYIRFCLTKLIYNGDSTDYKTIGFKGIEFEAYNNLYIKTFKNGIMVEYTDELLEKLIKIGLTLENSTILK